ncbi:MAG: ABC transporter ATP-binding protein [Phycisphaerae bacterium]
MDPASDSQPYLASFRRSFGYLRRHLKELVLGLVAAVGVGLFYTFSLSTTVPLLKIIFADHESLADWAERVEAERRLGCVLAADVPDNPQGLIINHVRPEGPTAGVLHNDDRIASIGALAPGAYRLIELVAAEPSTGISDVHVVSYDGAQCVVQLPLAPRRAWWGAVIAAAGWLPHGAGADARLTTLALVMGSLVVVSLLGGLCRFANEGLVATAVQRALHDLRSQLAEHVLRLPLSWHSAQPQGDTLSRFATDLSKVEVGLNTLFGKTIREPLKAISVLALTLLIDWRLLAVALIGLPIGAIVMRYFGNLTKRAQRRASQSWGRLLDHLGEKLAGIRVVKAYGMERAESRRFETEGRTLTRAQTHIELVDAATNPALELLAMMAVSMFVLYGASRVFNRELEPHLFFAAVVCLGGIFDPVRKMGNVYNRVQAADASARRLFDLMDLPIESGAPTGAPATVLAPLRESIEFRDVTFAYPGAPDREVLRGASLRVRKGEVIAIVGPNGSGKTTLISLLMRFFEPTHGQILIDGVNIADVTLESLRAQISLVTQDSVVFSDTVRDNIAYGANGVSDALIVNAARQAHIDDFIQTLRDNGDGAPRLAYDARVSARSLSGGQRQRIALARAILRDPPILVLDEATSQIDTESERKIQEALDDVTRGRTTFIIAHRFSTIARADVTVVLNEGRIIAVGRHAELLSTCPFYVALCETQFAHAI